MERVSALWVCLVLAALLLPLSADSLGLKVFPVALSTLLGLCATNPSLARWLAAVIWRSVPPTEEPTSPAAPQAPVPDQRDSPTTPDGAAKALHKRATWWINVFWIMSIAGIALSLFPALKRMVGPLHGLLVHLALDFLWPAIVCMHEWCVLEALLYTLCLAVGVRGAVSPKKVQRFYTLTCIGLSASALFYTVVVHTGTVDSSLLQSSLMPKWLFLLSVPWAASRPGGLIHFISAVSLYRWVLRSSVCFHVYNLLEVLGVSSSGDLSFRGSVASAVVAGLFFLTLALGKESLANSYARYVHFLGFHGAYFWGILLSSKWLHWGRGVVTERSFIVINLYIVGILAGGLYARGLKGLQYVSRFYLVGFSFVKFLELQEVCDWDASVFVLFISGIGWITANYLKRHPGYVAAMITGNYGRLDAVSVTATSFANCPCIQNTSPS